MAAKYRMLGFNDYVFENKTLYRKSYKIKTKTGNWQYREKRKINKVNNNGIVGYKLVKKGKRKFYSLNSLRDKLIKI